MAGQNTYSKGVSRFANETSKNTRSSRVYGSNDTETGTADTSISILVRGLQGVLDRARDWCIGADTGIQFSDNEE